MKTYDKKEKLVKVTCNQCEKELLVENGILKEGCFEANQTFGYFSQKDNITHSFDLCEACYDKWIHTFKIPVEEMEEKEYFTC